MLHHIGLKVQTNICDAAQWSCHTAKAWKIVWGWVFFCGVRPTQSPASARESCCDSCDSSTFSPFQLWLLPGKRHWLLGHSHHNMQASSAFPVSLHVCTRRTSTPCLLSPCLIPGESAKEAGAQKQVVITVGIFMDFTTDKQLWLSLPQHILGKTNMNF